MMMVMVNRILILTPNSFRLKLLFVHFVRTETEDGFFAGKKMPAGKKMIK